MFQGFKIMFFSVCLSGDLKASLLRVKVPQWSYWLTGGPLTAQWGNLWTFWRVRSYWLQLVYCCLIRLIYLKVTMTTPDILWWPTTIYLGLHHVPFLKKNFGMKCLFCMFSDFILNSCMYVYIIYVVHRKEMLCSRCSYQLLSTCSWQAGGKCHVIIWAAWP